MYVDIRYIIHIVNDGVMLNRLANCFIENSVLSFSYKNLL